MFRCAQNKTLITRLGVGWKAHTRVFQHQTTKQKYWLGHKENCWTNYHIFMNDVQMNERIESLSVYIMHPIHGSVRGNNLQMHNGDLELDCSICLSAISWPYTLMCLQYMRRWESLALCHSGKYPPPPPSYTLASSLSKDDSIWSL